MIIITITFSIYNLISLLTSSDSVFWSKEIGWTSLDTANYFCSLEPICFISLWFLSRPGTKNWISVLATDLPVQRSPELYWACSWDSLPHWSARLLCDNLSIEKQEAFIFFILLLWLNFFIHVIIFLTRCNLKQKGCFRYCFPEVLTGGIAQNPVGEVCLARTREGNNLFGGKINSLSLVLVS